MTGKAVAVSGEPAEGLSGHVSPEARHGYAVARFCLAPSRRVALCITWPRWNWLMPAGSCGPATLRLLSSSSVGLGGCRSHC